MRPMRPMCPECHKRQIQKHLNSKRCKPCALEIRKRPRSTLTKKEIQRAKKLIGTMPREEIAERLGTSLVNLMRAFKGTTLAFYNYCQKDPNLVRRVNSYYEKHGKTKSAQHFNLKPKQIEHIVYRYHQHKPRQIRWKGKEIIELARMAGLVSPRAQAKYFNRPGANAGSIKSAWVKNFRLAQRSINGMEHFRAKHLVTQKAKYLKPRGTARDGKLVAHRRVILWVDMAKVLKPEIPKHIRESVKSLAEFQKWLHGKRNTRENIINMMKERELTK